MNQVVLQSINPWRTDVYYNNKTKKYEFLGLKYSDLYFEKVLVNIRFQKINMMLLKN